MAIENGTQNAELGYILDPAFQIEGLNGKPVVGGWICIYEAGTNNKYISYENFDGAQNPFKIPLKSDGRAVILGDPSRTYDVYAYDSYGNQLFSRLNVQCNVPGNISINGADTRIKNTDGTLDVSLRTLGNNVREYTVNTNNKVLDLRAPLYFVENSNTATIIGLSGGGGGGGEGTTYYAGSNIAISDNVISGRDWTPELNNKLDTSAFDLPNSANWDNTYNTVLANSASWNEGGGGAGDPEVNDLVHANSATWNDVSAKLNTTAFSTASGSWNEASAFGANSGKFVTSAGFEFEDNLAYFLKKQADESMAWSGVDLSDLGKIYPISSLTPNLISATVSSVDGTPTYVLSAAQANLVSLTITPVIVDTTATLTIEQGGFASIDLTSEAALTAVSVVLTNTAGVAMPAMPVWWFKIKVGSDITLSVKIGATSVGWLGSEITNIALGKTVEINVVDGIACGGELV